MEKLKVPGLSVAVINDGKVVHQKTMGYTNVEEKLPITAETIFEGASLSKSVFAFFVMTYVEEGKLSLDKPLFEYLPYADIEYDDRYKKITARMVLSHRSGFPNWRRMRRMADLRSNLNLVHNTFIPERGTNTSRWCSDKLKVQTGMVWKLPFRQE